MFRYALIAILALTAVSIFPAFAAIDSSSIGDSVAIQVSHTKPTVNTDNSQVSDSASARLLIHNKDTLQMNDKQTGSPLVCGDSICGDSTQAERALLFSEIKTNPNAQSSGNYFIQTLMTPTGAQLTNFVISASDLTLLQNNVGIFTVCGGFENNLCQAPLLTQALPTTGYCTLADFIHINEDGYDNKTVGSSTIFAVTTPPASCGAQPNPTPSPEFGPIAALVLAIAIVSIIAVSAKTGLMPRY